MQLMHRRRRNDRIRALTHARNRNIGTNRLEHRQNLRDPTGVAHHRVHIHHIGVNQHRARHRQTRRQMSRHRATHGHTNDHHLQTLISQAAVPLLSRSQPLLVRAITQILPTGRVTSQHGHLHRIAELHKTLSHRAHTVRRTRKTMHQQNTHGMLRRIRGKRHGGVIERILLFPETTRQGILNILGRKKPALASLAAHPLERFQRVIENAHGPPSPTCTNMSAGEAL